MCYNCDDQFQPGHRCKRQFYLLIVEPETPDPQTEALIQLMLPPEPTLDPQPEPEPSVEPKPQISLHALMGHKIPQTLRVQGRINNHPLMVLVDSGSTHNFIQDRIARQLGFPLSPAQEFQVLVGNGEEFQCTSMCKQIPLQLDTHVFFVDLFLLPLSGTETVLGVQWWKTLGPVLTNYDNLTMSFFHSNHIIQLSGQPKPIPVEASFTPIQKIGSHRLSRYRLSLTNLPLTTGIFNQPDNTTSRNSIPNPQI